MKSDMYERVKLSGFLSLYSVYSLMAKHEYCDKYISDELKWFEMYSFCYNIRPRLLTMGKEWHTLRTTDVPILKII